MPRYDRFLLVNKIGRDRVLRRYFTPEERWCWVAGVLGISADSPIRGWLLLMEKVPADTEDVADAAGVSADVASSTVTKAELYGMVEFDDALDCLWVPDWEMYNPPSPKVDRTNADRQARYRARQKGEGNAEVTPTGNAEVTLDGNGAGNAPQGSKEVRKEGTTANAVVNDDRPEIAELCSLLADGVEQNGSPRPTVTKTWRDSARLLIDKDGRSAEEVRRAIAWCQADDFWRANVLSMPTLRKQFDRMRLQAERQRGGTLIEHPASRRIREIQELRDRLRAEEVA